MDRKLTEIIKKRYNRTALFYDWMDRMIATDWRRRVWREARGRVLEVGVGTGANFPFYPPGCQVTAIDFSPGMLARARQKLHLARVAVDLKEMDVQHLEFTDNSFDTVVATCVFCTVPDPVQGLKEVRRVCRPDGRIVLLEHVRSEHWLLGPLMDILNPLVLYLIGSNINRRTVANVRKAGIEIEREEDLAGKIVKLIIGHPG
ncbi:Ubiquinone/menaquinone biosynthesis C-methyltransferase UbiE [Neomoorella glycerini]|uniref:Ubiquinone/menaquinone biosynthesis C-methyltransferase UbiE n=1 Tax=Neomoorella glycerini TaxID=55779 RepID=A0A6I5ZPT4_9FIRM|nr:class I SAM-dependent methyltransferase [Moorella glycerini]QGP91982.1 Ubiquinone/menaquinone biosynthesis C-methyltransferase UbiE [Moorella glycerini]